jgi:hypothetical protein
MTKAMTKKEVAADAAEFADLYRDIRGQFTKGRPLRVALRHIRTGGQAGVDADVTSWEADHFEGLDPNEFTQTVITDILEDAKIFPPVVQKYGLFFFHKNTQSYNHRIFVTVKGGGPTDSGDVFSSEEPNDAGRMAQIMRHDEGFVRLTLGALQGTLNSQQRQLERSEALVEKLMAGFVPTMDALSRVMDRQAEREFDMDRKRKNYAMLDQAGEKIMQIAPFVIAGKLKDKNPEMASIIMKAASDPAREILKILMAEMQANPEKATEIFEKVGALPNGPVIIQALAQIAQQEEAEKKAATDAAKKNGQPG